MVESSPDSATSPETGESSVGDSTEGSSNSPINSVANTSQKSIEVLYAGNKNKERNTTKVKIITVFSPDKITLTFMTLLSQLMQTVIKPFVLDARRQYYINGDRKKHYS